ncbi:hypothetical protein H0H92_013656, partial [Tricholoma furcatifolium]
MPAPSDLDASFVLINDSANGIPSKANNSLELHPSLEVLYRPGSVPDTYAHDLSLRGTGGKTLQIQGRHFVDAYGRVRSLLPSLDDHFHSRKRLSTLQDSEDGVSHSVRVLHIPEWHPLSFDYSAVRFLVTWEAIEHAGPGIYDLEYLAYVRSLLSLLPSYGLSAFVSIHQDVWSRYSGGSGAPRWTLELAGFDIDALEETGAAWLAGVKGGGYEEEERGVWPTGYTKLAASTMATLFWAGETFAPKVKVNSNGDQVSIQHFLQDAFLAMSEILVQKVGDLDGVLGFEMFNEPHHGYVGLQSFHSFDYNTELHLAYSPTPIQSFFLGAGHPTPVAVYTRSFPMPTRHTSTVVMNTARQSAWRPDGPTAGKCIWEMHDVWGWDELKDEGIVLRESYFVKHPMTGTKVDWYTDFYFPFLKKWSERVRGATEKARGKISQLTAVVYIVLPATVDPRTSCAKHGVCASLVDGHRYDLNALFTKAFGDFTVNVQGLSRGMFPLKAFYWGQKGARDNYSLQISNLVKRAHESLAETPVLFGECGIPMDMNKKEAFLTEDFSWQARMMDAMLVALERSLVGFTLWTYNPPNADVQGDNWNGENFSWFSQRRAMPRSLLFFEQDAPSLDNGGRILNAVVRPYPAKVAGIPTAFEYEMNRGEFEFEWANPDEAPESGVGGSEALKALETEIYVPSMITQGRKLVVEGLDADAGDKYVHDERRQTLFVVARDRTPKRVHRIKVSVYPPLKPSFVINDLWGDFGTRIVLLG